MAGFPKNWAPLDFSNYQSLTLCKKSEKKQIRQFQRNISATYVWQSLIHKSLIDAWVQQKNLTEKESEHNNCSNISVCNIYKKITNKQKKYQYRNFSHLNTRWRFKSHQEIVIACKPLQIPNTVVYRSVHIQKNSEILY